MGTYMPIDVIIPAGRTGLHRIFVITGENTDGELCRAVTKDGLECVIAIFRQDILQQVSDESPSLVIADMEAILPVPSLWDLPHRIKKELNLPVIALVTPEMLDNDSLSRERFDDFVVKPFDPREIPVRVTRILHPGQQPETGERIACGDLLIDLARCEVSLSGRVIILTFMEYELLKFLANNKGRVFTRESLLNNVWGYDYFGGDRTVDVHIRRLRSKIEDAEHSFIDTVRNIGYRFKGNND
jgi:DNA-binding response OmpR family regulator